MAGERELNCSFLVTMSTGGDKKIRPSRSHPLMLCFYSLMRDRSKKPPRFLAVFSPSSRFSGCRKVSWGGETRGTHRSSATLFFMVFPNPLILEVGQQMSYPTAPTQASTSILGLPKQVNTDTTCFWGFTK